MNIAKTIGLGVSLLILPGAAAAAPFNPIQDFRDSIFKPVGNVASHLVELDGYDMLFETFALDGGSMVSDGALFWDDPDGFGIKDIGYEKDEIEGPEVFKISFSHLAYLDRVLVTDLFIEKGYAEIGFYSVDEGASWTSFSATGAHSNGSVEVEVYEKTHSILFTSPGRTNGQKHEFAVAGLDAHWDGHGPQGAVPEPGAALLFSAGFLLMRRRHQRR